jgi:hypothetical protein
MAIPLKTNTRRPSSAGKLTIWQQEMEQRLETLERDLQQGRTPFDTSAAVFARLGARIAAHQ